MLGPAPVPTTPAGALSQFAPQEDVRDTPTVTEYNRDDAIKLADELVEFAKAIAESVRKGPEASPMVDETCKRLGRVLSELKTVIRT